MANLKNKSNEYADAVGLDLFDSIPKSVWAAIAVSSLSDGGDRIAEAAELVLEEWRILNQNGIVPQAPPKRFEAPVLEGTRTLRISGHDDYIAVDIVDKGGKTISTPLYLQKGVASKVRVFDEEESRFVRADVYFLGSRKIRFEDEYGIAWEGDPEDLIDPKQYKF